MVPQISALVSLLLHSSIAEFFSSYSLPALEIRREPDTVIMQLEIRKVSGYPAVAAVPFPRSCSLCTLSRPLWIHLFLEAAMFGSTLPA